MDHCSYPLPIYCNFRSPDANATENITAFVGCHDLRVLCQRAGLQRVSGALGRRWQGHSNYLRRGRLTMLLTSAGACELLKMTERIGLSNRLPLDASSSWCDALDCNR